MEMGEFCDVGSCHGKFSTFVRKLCRFLSLETRHCSLTRRKYARRFLKMDANQRAIPYRFDRVRATDRKAALRCRTKISLNLMEHMLWHFFVCAQFLCVAEKLFYIFLRFLLSNWNFCFCNLGQWPWTIL